MPEARGAAAPAAAELGLVRARASLGNRLRRTARRGAPLLSVAASAGSAWASVERVGVCWASGAQKDGCGSGPLCARRTVASLEGEPARESGLLCSGDGVPAGTSCSASRRPSRTPSSESLSSISSPSPTSAALCAAALQRPLALLALPSLLLALLLPPVLLRLSPLLLRGAAWRPGSGWGGGAAAPGRGGSCAAALRDAPGAGPNWPLLPLPPLPPLLLLPLLLPLLALSPLLLCRAGWPTAGSCSACATVTGCRPWPGAAGAGAGAARGCAASGVLSGALHCAHGPDGSRKMPAGASSAPAATRGIRAGCMQS